MVFYSSDVTALSLTLTIGIFNMCNLRNGDSPYRNCWFDVANVTSLKYFMKMDHFYVVFAR